MRLRVALLLASLVPCLGYLPGHWTPKHAQGDFASADAVAIARVTAIDRIDEGVDPKVPGEHGFGFLATLRAGEVLKGDLKPGDAFRIYIGGCLVPEPPDETLPATIVLCNTQLGYDLRVNEVYVLGLNLVRPGPGEPALPPGPPLYDLRSGPCSAGWVTLATGSATARVVRQGAIGRQWREPVPFEQYIDCVRKGEPVGERPGK